MSKSNKTTEPELTYSQQWYLKNKDKHLAYITAKVHCDCGSITNRATLVRHQRSMKHKKWEDLEKDAKIKKCVCGGSYLTNAKNRHMKTEKHQDFLKSNQ